MANPLCPSLYQKLEERFGAVKISNEGESMVTTGPMTSMTASRGVQGGGEVSREEMIHPGEYYRVCCPKCQDTRYRLWISHRVIQYPWLIVCYNENCYDSVVARDSLIMFLFRSRPKKLAVIPGKKDSARLDKVDWPGQVYSLRDLPTNHPANDYLYSRGYDPWKLSEVYGLSYCERSAKYPQCSNRIIIPVYMRGVMVGWQARFIGERDWKSCSVPKYWDKPGMPKRLMFYNHDQAAQWPWCVIEEGVTDVWSTGTMAMGLLGGTITFAQKKLIAIGAFRLKPVVVMLDGEAYIENEAIAEELRRIHAPGVVIVSLPDGVDPGGLDHETNQSLIHEAAKQQGVVLPRS